MARIRKRASRVRLDFVELGTAAMVTTETGDVTGVEGAFVRVSPTLTASQRASYDSRAVVAKLRAAGARAVTLVPTVVPEGTRVEAEKISRAPDARAAVDAWLGDQEISSTIKARARVLILEWLAVEGM